MKKWYRMPRVKFFLLAAAHILAAAGVLCILWSTRYPMLIQELCSADAAKTYEESNAFANAVANANYHILDEIQYQYTSNASTLVIGILHNSLEIFPIISSSISSLATFFHMKFMRCNIRAPPFSILRIYKIGKEQVKDGRKRKILYRIERTNL